MTKTERMKLAIQQRQVAAKIESAVLEKAAEVPKPMPAAELVKPEPKKVKPPKQKKPDSYDRQPEKFDTALQLHDRGRLPAGAEFTVKWNGEEWTGILALTELEPTQIFALKGRKLFRLLADIDKLYREWKAKNAEGTT